MAPRNDLSASEKLLDLIRRNSPPPAVAPGEASAPAKPAAKGPGAAASRKKINLLGPRRSFSPSWRLPLRLSARGIATIGVDLQADSLTLVKIEPDPAGPRLTKQETIPLPAPPAAPLSKAELAALLGRELRRFGGEPPCALWAAIPRKQAEIIPLTIPVAAGVEPSEAVLWAVKKQTEVGDRLLDFTPVRETTPLPNKMRVLAFLSEPKAINELKELFTAAGFPLTGITLPSLAVQHLFSRNWLESPTESFVHLLLDEDQAYIDLYHQRQLLFSRDIKTGLSSLRVAEIAPPAPAPIPEANEEGREIELSLELESPTADGDEAPPPPPSPEEAAAEEPTIRFEPSAIHRLVRQLERTFDHCANNLNLPRPSKLYLAGRDELPDQLLAALEAELGVPCAFLDPFANGRLFLGGAIPPPRPHQRRLLTEAMGLALADNRQDQNYLFTSRARNEAKKVYRSNRLILTAFIILTLGLAIFYAGERRLLQRHKSELAGLEQQIATLAAGRTNPAELIQTAATIKEKRKRAEKLTANFRALALIGHALERRPPEIRLSELAVDPTGRLTLQGMAQGEGLRKELILTQYLRELATSPLIGEGKITDKSNGRLGEEEFLAFAIQLEPPAPPEKEAPAKDQQKPGGKK